jgi:hypothetical protein
VIFTALRFLPPRNDVYDATIYAAEQQLCPGRAQSNYSAAVSWPESSGLRDLPCKEGKFVLHVSCSHGDNAF